MTTNSGRMLGRKPDTPDPRDRTFAAEPVYGLMGAIGFPDMVDLRFRMPPVYDQGEMSSCGPNSVAAFHSVMFPEVHGGFSRLQIYYGVRVLENDVSEDNGVETRDLFRVVKNTGAAPEALWPYDRSKLFIAPPVGVITEAAEYRLSYYMRLLTAWDIMKCLSDGFPFVVGITLFEAFDGDEVARTGVLRRPDPSRERVIGGHDMLAVGYDLHFRKSKVLADSGIDPQAVSDRMLLVRNSWGADWALSGYAWITFDYVLDATLGADLWSGRK